MNKQMNKRVADEQEPGALFDEYWNVQLCGKCSKKDIKDMFCFCVQKYAGFCTRKCVYDRPSYAVPISE